MNPTSTSSQPVVEGDFRKQTGTQDFVATAPVNLVYVADFGRFKKLSPRFASTPTEELMKWVCLEVGHQSQNVYLYCASEKLGATFRVSVDRERLGKLLKLHPGQAVIAAPDGRNPQIAGPQTRSCPGGRHGGDTSGRAPTTAGRPAASVADMVATLRAVAGVAPSLASTADDSVGGRCRPPIFSQPSSCRSPQVARRARIRRGFRPGHASCPV